MQYVIFNNFMYHAVSRDVRILSPFVVVFLGLFVQQLKLRWNLM